MLADTPKARYQTTREVLTQLEQLEAQPAFLSSEQTLYEAPTVIGYQSNNLGIPNSDQQLQPTAVDFPDDWQNNSNKHQLKLSNSFIENCQQVLAYYIGPMANIIVEDVLATNPQATPHQFVELLAREISDSQTAIEFTGQIFSGNS